MRTHSCFLFLSVTVLSFGIVGCSKTQSVSAAPAQDANGNLAPVGDDNQAAPQTYAGQPAYPAPVTPSAYPQANGDPNYAQTYAYDDTVDDGSPVVYAPQPPPPLPDYSQPPAPGDDYIWTPGYWAYADADYYWVPGVWVLAPYVDALWTPPYWDFYSGRYRWHRGYWGTHIGFYGGINYGFGYTGRGYYGGYWNNGRFAYNRAVTNVNVNIVHNVYDRRVTNVTVNRISYNGGSGGINARPIAAEAAALRERRTAPVAAQIQHDRGAEQNRQQFASVNRGRPAVVAQNNALATPYRAPAARPTGPELPRRVAQNERPRQEVRPNQPAPPLQNERSFAQRGAPAPVPAQAPQVNRPDFGRQNQEPRPVAPPIQRVQPQPVPAQRPEIPRAEPQRQLRQPESQQPQQVPQGRPQSERRAPQAEPRQAPRIHEAPPAARPQPFERPQPQARPEQPRPQPQARPEPPPRAQAQPRPEPPRPQPAARPAPAPQQQDHGKGDGRGRHE